MKRIALFAHGFCAWQAAGLAAALILSVATPARAQEQAADSAAHELESLVVEALRLPTAARAAPWSVTVLDEIDTRAARSGRSLAEALRGVPGVQVSDRSNDALGDRIVVRGAGARAGFGVRGVRVLIDGIPATLPDGQTDLSRLDLATVGRIEVLRGPAAALYGNASGGVVRISSASPSLRRFGAEGEALVGSHDLLRLHARVSGQPAFAWYDVSATHRRLEGFRLYNESERSFVRAAGGFPLGSGHMTLQATGNAYEADNPGALTAAQLAERPTQANPINFARQAGESAWQALAGTSWTGTAGPGVLEVTGYASRRSLDNPIPVAIIDVERAFGGVSAIWGLPWLVLGGELDYQRDDRRNFENLDGDEGDLTLDQLERVRALGGFAQARVPIGERFNVTGALRYDRFGFEVDDRLVDPDPDDSGERTMDALSPSLGVYADLGGTLGLFANVASAFETPTTTELANQPDGAGGFNPDLEPQRTLSFETGLRGYATSAVRFELTGWLARTEDALVPFEIPGAGGRQYFRNAGSTRSHGVEAAVFGTGPLRLEWDVAYAWIDARFDEFSDDTASYDGNEVPGIPPHHIAASISRRTQAWFAAFEATHVAAIAVNDPNSAHAEGWTTLDVRGEARLLDRIGGVWLFVGLTNLLDEQYVGSVVVNAFGGRYFEPAPGRGVYFGLRAGGR